MSFYGNVTYYLSNAFNKVIYRNANNACMNGNVEVHDGVSGPGAISYEYTLSPRSRSDDVILETGNKWIVFADPEGTQGNNQIRIFHTLSAASTLGQGGTIATSIVNQDAVDQTVTQLNFKSLITLPTITFDQAGHISAVGSEQYQLAEPPGAQDIQQLRTDLTTLKNSVENNDRTYGQLIQNLQQQVSVWDMRSVGDAYNNMKEENGIGTVLHDVLVELGLRKKHSNAYDQKDGYETVSPVMAESDSSCLIGKTYMAYNAAQNASSVAAGNRLGVRALLDMLVASHAIEASDRDSLKTQYFIVSGDVVTPTEPTDNG